MTSGSGSPHKHRRPHVNQQLHPPPDISTPALHNGRRRKDPVGAVRQCLARPPADRIQVPQARLVARRWLVCAAWQLEGQHRCCRRRSRQHRRLCLDHFRTARIPPQDARAGPLLPQPIVRHSRPRGEGPTRMQDTLLTPRSWSRQIIEHEKKLKEEGQ